MKPPEPRSISPALWHHRQTVMTWLDRPWRDLYAGLHLAEPVAYILDSYPDSTYSPYEPTLREVHLQARRVMGPAPWTEHSYHYEWKVAQGPAGYWAATDAEPIPGATWDSRGW